MAGLSVSKDGVGLTQQICDSCFVVLLSLIMRGAIVSGGGVNCGTVSTLETAISLLRTGGRSLRREKEPNAEELTALLCIVMSD